MKIQNSISNLNQSLAKLNSASKKTFNQLNRDNRVKSVLILAVGIAAASFTTKTIMEKVSVKSSSITWVGKKVTGKFVELAERFDPRFHHLDNIEQVVPILITVPVWLQLTHGV